MSLKRLAVKYIRDKAKSKYIKEDTCYICSSSEELQLHHFNSVTPLWDRWVKKNKYRILTEESVMLYRDSFIAQHQSELYEEVVTLCKPCHMDKLHKVFGKCPIPSSAKAQAKWVNKMRDKQ